MGALSWLRGGNDRQLAATRYAGRTSATARNASKQAERGSMGRPDANARQADRRGWSWADRQR